MKAKNKKWTTPQNIVVSLLLLLYNGSTIVGFVSGLHTHVITASMQPSIHPAGAWSCHYKEKNNPCFYMLPLSMTSLSINNLKTVIFKNSNSIVITLNNNKHFRGNYTYYGIKTEYHYKTAAPHPHKVIIKLCMNPQDKLAALIRPPTPPPI